MKKRDLPKHRLVVGVAGHDARAILEEEAMKLISLAFDNIVRWHSADEYVLALDAEVGAGVASLASQVAHRRGWPVEQYDNLHAPPVPYHALVKLGGDDTVRQQAEAFRREHGPVYEYTL